MLAALQQLVSTAAVNTLSDKVSKATAQPRYVNTPRVIETLPNGQPPSKIPIAAAGKANRDRLNNYAGASYLQPSTMGYRDYHADNFPLPFAQIVYLKKPPAQTERIRTNIRDIVPNFAEKERVAKYKAMMEISSGDVNIERSPVGPVKRGRRYVPYKPRFRTKCTDPRNHESKPLYTPLHLY